MLALFDRGLDAVAGDLKRGEGHLAGGGLGDDSALCSYTGDSHDSRAGGVQRVGGVDVGAECREVVEVGFEVLEVEGEVEDVGVTAYHGAAPLITNKTTILPAAAGILAVEAYHAGLVRTTINALDPTGSLGLLKYTQQISAVRTGAAQAAATGTKIVDDFGVGPQTVSLAGGGSVPATTIVDADPTNVIAFSRTTTQVLNIVTGGNATTAGSPAKGVFFPNGLNGLFT